MQNDKHLRFRKKLWVMEVTGLSSNTLDRMIKAGRFPAPVKPHNGSRINLWLEESVYHWIAERADITETKGSRATTATTQEVRIKNDG